LLEQYLPLTLFSQQHTVSWYIHEGAQWGQSSATTQKMLDAANSESNLYETEKFNLFRNGFARKLSDVEFSALMVVYLLFFLSFCSTYQVSNSLQLIVH
jgi:hypothetical protein